MNHIEDDEQAVVIEWALRLEHQYPCLKWLFHIPNGGFRKPYEAVRLKNQGVKSGVADLFLPFPIGIYHGLFIEMKSKGGKISVNQKHFIEDMTEAEYKCKVCYNADEAIKELENYIKGGQQCKKT